ALYKGFQKNPFSRLSYQPHRPAQIFNLRHLSPESAMVKGARSLLCTSIRYEVCAERAEAVGSQAGQPWQTRKSKWRIKAGLLDMLTATLPASRKPGHA